MKRLAWFICLSAVACHDSQPVVDRGGRSLDVPVPSSGVAATVKGPEKDISDFPKPARQDPSRLEVKTGAYGPFLVDASGRSLYAFSGDAPGQTACFTNCTTVWPPVLVDKLPSITSASLDASKLGTTTRSDGARQLTYAGHPLYYAESDRKPGDTWGHDAMSFGGRFALVAPDGRLVPPPK
jgi:predicted lipoprotein with Yx(FWY)xxD motif